jgi:ATP-dependent RNA helicase DeaD
LTLKFILVPRKKSKASKPSGRTRQPRDNASTPAAAEESGFATMGLSAELLSALRDANYQQPTPVQAGVIPIAIQGVDVMAQARTGTGKTAAFAIPILERLLPHSEVHAPQAMILVPTRELAVQVEGEVKKLGSHMQVRCTAVYGGQPIRKQIERLKRGCQVVVGTPGRVIDHIGRGTLDCTKLHCVVLDEADRMLDIGFRPDIEKILRRVPRERQTLLLSATVPPPIERLAKRYMQDPEHLNFSVGEMSVDTIEQFYFTVDPTRKFDLLERLLEREQPSQAIIFCRTKRGTEKIYQRLSKRYKNMGSMHGDMAQRDRDRTMANFRDGKVKYLVATDVVGRGIDVSGISHIINYDIPEFCDDYVHRVGRTGRMGRDGVAFTFVSPEEGKELTRIEMRIDRLLKRDVLEGFESRPAPVRQTDEAERPAPTEESREAESETSSETKPPAPLFGPGGRPKKKYRRAL